MSEADAYTYQIASPVDGQPVMVTKDQWHAERPYNQVTDALNSSVQRWRPGDAHNDHTRYFRPDTWGKALRKRMQKGDMSFLGDAAQQGMGTGALTYGGTGMLAGLLTGTVADFVTGGEGGAQRMALLGGVAGAAFGGLSGHLNTMNKTAYRLGPDSAKDELVELLMMQSTHAPQETQALASRIMSLQGSQADDLLRMVSHVGPGVAVGMIAKYLLGAGLIPATLLGLGASTLASNLTRETNSYGQGTHKGYDLYGQPL